MVVGDDNFYIIVDFENNLRSLREGGMNEITAKANFSPLYMHMQNFFNLMSLQL